MDFDEIEYMQAKKLKENGTSFYAFPGAAEDISVSYQNVNHKMYFSDTFIYLLS